MSAIHEKICNYNGSYLPTDNDSTYESYSLQFGVDTTYNENTDFPYLCNVTAFNYKVMRWMAIARVRSNKENSQFYATAFKEIFRQCKEDHKNFDVRNLKGIVLDWSDAEKRVRRRSGKRNSRKAYDWMSRAL
jgi:hypothetical protein